MVLLSTVALSVLPGAFILALPLSVKVWFAFGYSTVSVFALMFTMNFFAENILQRIRVVLYNKKHPSTEWESPKARELASEMGVSYNRIELTDYPRVKGPYTDPYSKVITAPSSWTLLPSREVLAWVAHELSHIKRRGAFLKELLLIFGVAAAFTLVLEIISVPIVAWLAEMPMVMLLFSRASWHNEYRADADSADAVGPEPLIAVFERLLNPNRRDEGSETHPPLGERIRKLMRRFDE